MPMKTTDRLLGPARGTLDEALAYLAANGDDVAARDYLHEAYRLAPIVGLDPAIVVSQSAHETSAWTSFWWTTRHNPAGIGITGDPVENNQSHLWANGTDAARAQITHLAAYAIGTLPADSPLLAYDADPRWSNVFDAGWDNSARTIADLTGKWAVDPRYAEQIVARSFAIFRNLPDQGVNTPVADSLNMTPALIPLPAMIADEIDVSQRDQSLACRGYDNLGPRPAVPKFLVLHRSVNGADQSNSGYFHEACCPALTDLEVVAATGQGRWFVRLPGNVSGWANGVVSAPYGDALAWLNQHGFDLNTVNRDGESVEITGNYDDPVSDRAWQWLAQWIASRAHDYGIRWDTFPQIPGEGNRSYVTWHQEWTIGTGKICPGPVVMNYTPTLFERARAIMKAAQTTGKPPVGPPQKQPYASPVPEVLAFIQADLQKGHPIDHEWKGLAVHAALRPYAVVKATKRLQYPDPQAPQVGPPIAVGTQFLGRYWLPATDAAGVKRNYVLTEYASFVQAAALDPRISVKKV